jgi:release factor glutamine methyltransferase
MVNAERVWTLIDIVDWGKEYFEKKNIDSPRLTIELMLCNLLNIERIQIYTQYDRPLLKSELNTLREIILRRAKHEPLQYILGSTDFYGFKFKVNNSVIIPRPETELLVELAIKSTFDKDNISILDIGTGSGCIAISIASNYYNSNITAIDISEEALKLAAVNAIENNIERIKFKNCDILTETITEGPFDLIVSNPPYIPLTEYQQLDPELLNYEPDISLTDKADGLTFYRHFAKIFRNILKPDGKFFLEFGYGQKDSIQEIFKKENWETRCYNDAGGIPRVITNLIDN